MGQIPRLLVVQRISLSHRRLMSRSIGARFGPLLSYMRGQGLIHWEQIIESDVTVRQLQKFDAVLFNKHNSDRAVQIMSMANDLGLRTIYDLDDWIIDLPSYSVTELGEDRIENIAWLVRNASVATASNGVLKKRLESLRSCVIEIRNGFDHEALPWCPEARNEGAEKRIVFSNTDGIKLVKFRKEFFEVLADFLRHNHDVTLDFWGDDFPEMSWIPRIEPKGFLDNVSYKRAIRDAGYMFAIVPLGGPEDNETLFFNSCKSCIKYIDYGSLGIPGIYSRTPVYESVVEHRVTGLLAHNSGDEFAAALQEMRDDAELRERIRYNAHRDATERFGIEAPARVLLSVLSG